MPEYLLTARGADGRAFTENVEAASADEAVAVLRGRGCDDVVLHTDDAAAHYTRQRANDHAVPPAEFVALRDRGGYLHRVFADVRKSYARDWLLWVVVVALAVAGRLAGRSWWIFDALAVVALAYPLVHVAVAHAFGTSLRYDRLQEAVAWGRWEEVLRRTPPLARSLPYEEVAFRTAQALAGLGRLDEAVETVRPLGDGAQMPAWLYHGRTAEVYFAARDVDAALAALERAVEAAPENATALLDLAASLARYGRDLRRARALFDRAKGHALSDVLVPIAGLTEGVLLLEEGDALSAKARLEEALAGIERFRNATPLIGIFVDICRAYLALAHAALGDRDAARAHYAAAEPRLRALRIEELTTRCERALGTADANGGGR